MDFGGPRHCVRFFNLGIFKEFGGHIFQQIISISMGTNCAPLIGDLLLYCYKTEFMQKLIINKMCRLKYLILYSVRYIDQVLSINNPSFALWSWSMIIGFATTVPVQSMSITINVVSSNPINGKMYRMQHYAINLSVTCVRSVVFFRYSGFSTNKTDHYDITEILLNVG